MKVTLRPSINQDFEFVFNLNKTNMKKYVDQIRVWDDTYERADMQTKFTPGIDQIIQVDGKDAGVWRIITEPDYLKIDHVELLPEFQNFGIGTKLINELLAKAKQENKYVLVQTLKVNPALNLYIKLGFKKIGEDNLKIKLQFN